MADFYDPACPTDDPVDSPRLSPVLAGLVDYGSNESEQSGPENEVSKPVSPKSPKIILKKNTNKEWVIAASEDLNEMAVEELSSLATTSESEGDDAEGKLPSVGMSPTLDSPCTESQTEDDSQTGDEEESRRTKVKSLLSLQRNLLYEIQELNAAKQGKQGDHIETIPECKIVSSRDIDTVPSLPSFSTSNETDVSGVSQSTSACSFTPINQDVSPGEQVNLKLNSETIAIGEPPPDQEPSVTENKPPKTTHDEPMSSVSHSVFEVFESENKTVTKLSEKIDENLILSVPQPVPPPSLDIAFQPSECLLVKDIVPEAATPMLSQDSNPLSVEDQSLTETMHDPAKQMDSAAIAISDSITEAKAVPTSPHAHCTLKESTENIGALTSESKKVSTNTKTNIPGTESSSIVYKENSSASYVENVTLHSPTHKKQVETANKDLDQKETKISADPSSTEDSKKSSKLDSDKGADILNIPLPSSTSLSSQKKPPTRRKSKAAMDWESPPVQRKPVPRLPPNENKGLSLERFKPKLFTTVASSEPNPEATARIGQPSSPTPPAASDQEDRQANRTFYEDRQLSIPVSLDQPIVHVCQDEKPNVPTHQEQSNIPVHQEQSSAPVYQGHPGGLPSHTQQTEIQPLIPGYQEGLVPQPNVPPPLHTQGPFHQLSDEHTFPFQSQPLPMMVVPEAMPSQQLVSSPERSRFMSQPPHNIFHPDIGMPPHMVPAPPHPVSAPPQQSFFQPAPKPVSGLPQQSIIPPPLQPAKPVSSKMPSKIPSLLDIPLPGTIIPKIPPLPVQPPLPSEGNIPLPPEPSNIPVPVPPLPPEDKPPLPPEPTSEPVDMFEQPPPLPEETTLAQTTEPVKTDVEESAPKPEPKSKINMLIQSKMSQLNSSQSSTSLFKGMIMIGKKSKPTEAGKIKFQLKKAVQKVKVFDEDSDSGGENDQSAEHTSSQKISPQGKTEAKKGDVLGVDDTSQKEELTAFDAQFTLNALKEKWALINAKKEKLEQSMISKSTIDTNVDTSNESEEHPTKSELLLAQKTHTNKFEKQEELRPCTPEIIAKESKEKQSKNRSESRSISPQVERARGRRDSDSEDERDRHNDRRRNRDDRDRDRRDRDQRYDRPRIRDDRYRHRDDYRERQSRYRSDRYGKHRDEDTRFDRDRRRSRDDRNRDDRDRYRDSDERHHRRDDRDRHRGRGDSDDENRGRDRNSYERERRGDRRRSPERERDYSGNEQTEGHEKYNKEKDMHDRKKEQYHHPLDDKESDLNMVDMDISSPEKSKESDSDVSNRVYPKQSTIEPVLEAVGRTLSSQNISIAVDAMPEEIPLPGGSVKSNLIHIPLPPTTETSASRNVASHTSQIPLSVQGITAAQPVPLPSQIPLPVPAVQQLIPVPPVSYPAQSNTAVQQVPFVGSIPQSIPPGQVLPVVGLQAEPVTNIYTKGIDPASIPVPSIPVTSILGTSKVQSSTDNNTSVDDIPPPPPPPRKSATTKKRVTFDDEVMVEEIPSKEEAMMQELMSAAEEDLPPPPPPPPQQFRPFQYHVMPDEDDDIPPPPPPKQITSAEDDIPPPPPPPPKKEESQPQEEENEEESDMPSLPPIPLPVEKTDILWAKATGGAITPKDPSAAAILWGKMQHKAPPKPGRLKGLSDETVESSGIEEDIEEVEMDIEPPVMGAETTDMLNQSSDTKEFERTWSEYEGKLKTELFPKTDVPSVAQNNEVTAPITFPANMPSETSAVETELNQTLVSGQSLLKSPRPGLFETMAEGMARPGLFESRGEKGPRLGLFESKGGAEPVFSKEPLKEQGNKSKIQIFFSTTSAQLASTAPPPPVPPVEKVAEDLSEITSVTNIESFEKPDVENKIEESTEGTPKSSKKGKKRKSRWGPEMTEVVDVNEDSNSESTPKRQQSDSNEDSNSENTPRRRSGRIKSLEEKAKQEKEEKEKRDREERERQERERKAKEQIKQAKIEKDRVLGVESDKPAEEQKTSILSLIKQVPSSDKVETKVNFPVRNENDSVTTLKVEEGNRKDEMASPSLKPKSRWLYFCESEGSIDSSSVIKQELTFSEDAKPSDKEEVTSTGDVPESQSSNIKDKAEKDFKVPVLKLERIETDPKYKDLDVSPGMEKEKPVIEPVTEKPPHFEQIEDNYYLSERKKSKAKKEVRRMVCDCTTSSEDRRMGYPACGSDCINRMLNIECGSRCPCGDYCTNKRFKKHQYSDVEPFKTSWKGWGLRAKTQLDKHAFVMEYVGEVLDYEQFVTRSKRYGKDSQLHYYFMALNTDEIIDATYKGNVSRFINHSCDPNCETQKWTVNGQLRVGFFTIRDIPPGDELTFDYQFERYGDFTQKCFCGSANCRGVLGVEKKVNNTEKKKKEKKRIEIFDDILLEEEIEKMSSYNGLKNKKQVLELSRLMVRAESPEHRMTLLKIIKDTKEPDCLRLFLGYHGLQLLWSWMSDIAEGLEDLKREILSVLKFLPITNKTILEESKIIHIVKKWAMELSKPKDDNKLDDKSDDKDTETESASEPPSRSETPIISGGNGSDTGENSIKIEGLKLDLLDKIPSKKRILQRVKAQDETSGSDSEMSESSRLSASTSQTLDASMNSNLGNSQDTSILSTSLQTLNESLTTLASSQNSQISESIEMVDPELENKPDAEAIAETDDLAKSNKDQLELENSEAANMDDTEKEVIDSQDETLDSQKDTDDSQVVSVDSQKEAVDTSTVSADQEESVDITTVKQHTEVDSSTGDVGISLKSNEDPENLEAEQTDQGNVDTADADEDTGMKEEIPSIADFASELLESWSELKEIYRIPKKQQVEERKRTERELDRRDRERSDRDRRDSYDRDRDRHSRRDSRGYDRDRYDRDRDYDRRDRDRNRDREYDRRDRKRPYDNSPDRDSKYSRNERGSRSKRKDSDDRNNPDGPDTPKLSKEERRQLFEAQVKAQDELDEIQRQEMQRQQEEFEQQQYQFFAEHGYPMPMQVDPVTNQLVPVPHDPNLPPGVIPIDPNTQQPYLPDPNTQPTYGNIPYEQYPAQPQYPPQVQYMEPVSQQPQYIDPNQPPQVIYQQPVQQPGYPVQQVQPTYLQPQPQYVQAPPQPQYVQQPQQVYYTTPQGTVVYAQPPGGQQPAIVQQVPVHMQQPMQAISPHSQQMAPEMVDEDLPPPPAPPPKVKKPLLPPNWKTAKDPEGKTYYYHTVTRQTQWDAPSWEGSEQDDSVDVGTPVVEEKKSNLKKKTTTAAADTSSEFAKRCKEGFRVKMSQHIVLCLNPFRKPDCKMGRITSTDDFKHLARKLTHAVMSKELKHCKHPEDLEVNENVKSKAKDYVKKYMGKFGKVYKKDDE